MNMVNEDGNEQIGNHDIRGLGTRKLDEALGTERESTSPRLRLFRTITGQGFDKKGSWVHMGINEDRLRNYGIFNSNLSWDQIYGGRGRRVIGLPISLSTSEAIMWLEAKKYEKPPAVVVLEIPVDYFSDSEGTLKLTQNAEDEKFDMQITESMILEHIQGKRKISGECFLTSLNSPTVPDSVRQFERVMIPKKLNSDGTIDFSTGFEELIFEDKK